MTEFLVSFSIGFFVSLSCLMLLGYERVRERQRRRKLDEPKVHPAIKAYYDGDIATIEEMEDYLDGRRTWGVDYAWDHPAVSPTAEYCEHHTLDWIRAVGQADPVEGICTECGRSWPYSECRAPAIESDDLISRNEFQEQLAEQRETLMRREEFEAAHARLARQIDELKHRVDVRVDSVWRGE